MSRTIQDSVHGVIKLPGWVINFIDTPQFQRLRRVKQLGFANLVYPGANHTRFEHSLGTYFITSKLIDGLEADESVKMELLAASLLHDICHSPFSHSSDRIVREYLKTSHEDIDRHLKGSEIEEKIDELGLSLKKIAMHVKGRSKYNLVNGEIDADRMDYLVRDSYYTGVAYGVFDISRLIETLKFEGETLVIDEKGLRAAESLLISRFMMYPTVYFHHVCRIAKKMYEKALEHAISDGKLKPSELLRMDDCEISWFLKHVGGYPAEIMQRIEERRLFKRAIYVGRDRIGIEIERLTEERAEIELASISGVDEENIIVDIPPLEPPKEVSAVVDFGGEKLKLEECSPLVRALKQTERDSWMMGIYTTKENIEEVAKAAIRFFKIQRKPLQRRLDEIY
ncbi:MAG: HD domain-containing protein [Archaeoglobus sp.]|nr:HD domain-containing protein [Archaeoglobus sp.]